MKVTPRVTPRVLFSVAVFLFFGYFVWQAREWRLQARLYPWSIGIPMIVLAFVNLVREFLGLGKAKGSGAGPADIQLTQTEDPRVALRRTLNIVGWILGFLAGFWLFGFSLTLAVLIFCYLKIQSREGWLMSVTLTAGAWLIFWGLFDYTLRLPFPDGQVFLWLGG
jgi:hypothetical protein